MATPSLYRRYRPRRFSELKGQDHVVRALRNAVANHREGHAYLFSGPRGTGKTSSARILAKVLNCEAVVDGEPCCACSSCAAVEAGTSYDVFELDAASNRGIDDIRTLIERASLGTPGRHKVYILDEVHMLTKEANAALLKTLEEPPDHVVFVLATTDPQKVPETIRSRTQHLQFHLLGADTLHEHVRWVAADAGIELDDTAVATVVSRGAGSARDTLSALEVVVAAGGVVEHDPHLEDLLDALADHDTGLALATIAHAVQQGRDPRSVTEEVVRTLREAFLTLVAPELVQVPGGRLEELTEQARRVGAARLVRAMEVLGQALLEMRHAPDPRLLVEVALVKLTHAEVDPGIASLLVRIKHLEDQMAQGITLAGAPALAAPVDPVTGRAKLGSLAGDATGPVARPVAPAPAPAPEAAAAPAAAAVPIDMERLSQVWSADVLTTLKPLVRALYAAGTLLGERDGALAIALPNEPHRDRAEQYRGEVEAAVAKVAGRPLRVSLVVDASSRTGRDATGGTPRPEVSGAATADVDVVDEVAEHLGDVENARSLPDVPAGVIDNPIERLAQAFPGAELIDDD